MKKRLQKFLAMVLIVSMCVSLLSIHVVAADEQTTGTVEVESKPGGETENVNVTITVTPETSTTVKETAEGGDTTESGLNVQYSGTETTETTDGEGNVVSGESSYVATNADNTYKAEGGSSITTEEAKQTEIPVILIKDGNAEGKIEGSANSGSSTDGWVPTNEGDQTKEQNPASYDQTKITETDRVVDGEVEIGAVEANKVFYDKDGNEIEYESGKVIGLDTTNPGPIDGKKQVHGTKWEMTDEEIAAALAKKEADGKLEGYDYLYVGHGEDSYYGAHWNLSDKPGTFGKDNLYSDGESRWSGWDYGCGTSQFQLVDPTTGEDVLKRDAAGNPIPVLDDEGNPVQATDPDGKPLTDAEGNPVYEYETKKNFDFYTAYCADIDTGSKIGWWYKVQNLEDSEYYKNKEGAENHIRAVVMNGYWGTTGTETDENGNTVPVRGSLDAMKQMLNAAIDAGKLTTMTKADVAALTEGQALTATQMAVWEYGNPYEEITLGANTYDGKWYVNEEVTALGKEGILKELERINAVAYYLMSLSMTAEEAGTTTVINEKNFIKDMSMTVGGKVEGHENNADDKTDNDAYYVDLNFSLVVTPGVGDDLVVKVINSSNEVVSTARIAGDGSSDVGFGKITTTKDAKGNITSYTMTGLELVEGSDTKFNLKLEGAQYLEEGVYIYSSQIRSEVEEGVELNGDYSWEKGYMKDENVTSQTFVGIAEGYRSVDVSMEIDLNFNVEEATITTERVWRTESDPGAETSPEPEPEPPVVIPPEDDPPLVEIPEEEPPLVEIPEEEPPLVEIPDEEVPLANVPKTGDASAVWMILGVISALALAGVTVIGSKKRSEA